LSTTGIARASFRGDSRQVFKEILKSFEKSVDIGGVAVILFLVSTRKKAPAAAKANAKDEKNKFDNLRSSS
jgi:hypothetical protein